MHGPSNKRKFESFFENIVIIIIIAVILFVIGLFGMKSNERADAYKKATVLCEQFNMLPFTAQEGYFCAYDVHLEKS